MNQRDFYQVLGVARDASSADIRLAFIRLARLHHPDAAGDSGTLYWRLQEVQQAYRFLLDNDARAAHDRALEENDRQHFARQRRARRRLRRYDRHHPRPPRRSIRIRWRSVLIIVACVAIVTLLAQNVLRELFRPKAGEHNSHSSQGN